MVQAKGEQGGSNYYTEPLFYVPSSLVHDWKKSQWNFEGLSVFSLYFHFFLTLRPCLFIYSSKAMFTQSKANDLKI